MKKNVIYPDTTEKSLSIPSPFLFVLMLTWQKKKQCLKMKVDKWKLVGGRKYFLIISLWQEQPALNYSKCYDTGCPRGQPQKQK